MASQEEGCIDRVGEPRVKRPGCRLGFGREDSEYPEVTGICHAERSEASLSSNNRVLLTGGKNG